MSTEAMKLALEALGLYARTLAPTETQKKGMEAITALDEALAQPQQEPVDKKGSPCPEFWDWLPKAYNFEGVGNFTKYNMEVAFLAGMQTTSPPAQPQPLTDEQIETVWRSVQANDFHDCVKPFARAIEAAHNIKGDA